MTEKDIDPFSVAVGASTKSNDSVASASRPRDIPEGPKEPPLLSRKPTLKVNNSPSNKPTPILKSESKVSVLSPDVAQKSTSPSAVPKPETGQKSVDNLVKQPTNLTNVKSNTTSGSPNPDTRHPLTSALNLANVNNTASATISTPAGSTNLYNDENSLMNANLDLVAILKRTSSLSFTEPSDIAKSRRGSISTNPSKVSLAAANANRHHPQNQLNQQRNPTLSRNPSLSGSKVTDPSVLKNAISNLNSDALNFTAKKTYPGSPKELEQRTFQQVDGADRLDRVSSAGARVSLPPPEFSEKQSLNSANVGSSRSAQVSRSSSSERPGYYSPNMSEADANLIRKNLSMKKPPKAVIQAEETPKYPFVKYFQKTDDNKVHILLGASGSVATIKIPELIDKIYKVFTRERVSIQLVITKYAEHFLKGFKIPSDIKIWRDQDEWFGYSNNDPILHIELRKWADIFIVAPVSANTLAKVSNGIADNLLTSIFRAWNPSNPIVIAPAMNTFMYTHPVTKIQLDAIKGYFPWIHVLKPVEKILVCGDIGMGGMTTVHEIAISAKKELLAVKKKQLELKREKSGEAETVHLEEDENAQQEDAEDDNEDEEDDDEEDDDDSDDSEDNDDDEDDDSETDDDDDEEDVDDEEVNNILQRVNTRTKMQKSAVNISQIPEEGEDDGEASKGRDSGFHDIEDHGSAGG